MKPYKFNECNLTYAETQPEYLPLPVYKESDGTITCCWSLSFLEKLKVLFTGKIFLQVLTFNTPLQPLKLEVNNPVKGKPWKL